ncbi:hypothetical protein DOY81_009485 [Sarcophaga bullata]|nr:hypothetical protein DOY81_009485 [Sarcophaga bullata]
MATKQELMNMMENRLPGEAVPVRDPTVQPPGYPDLDRVNYAAQQHMDQQNGPAPGPGHRQIYSIQPPQAIVAAAVCHIVSITVKVPAIIARIVAVIWEPMQNKCHFAK